MCTPQKPTLFDGHYLLNRSTLDIGVLGIGIVQHKEHPPEVLSIPPGTPCIYIITYTFVVCCPIKHGDNFNYIYLSFLHTDFRDATAVQAFLPIETIRYISAFMEPLSPFLRKYALGCHSFVIC